MYAHGARSTRRANDFVYRSLCLLERATHDDTGSTDWVASLNPEQLARLQADNRPYSRTACTGLRLYFWGVLNRAQALLPSRLLLRKMPGLRLSPLRKPAMRRVAEALRRWAAGGQLNVTLVNAGDYKFKQIASENCW